MLELDLNQSAGFNLDGLSRNGVTTDSMASIMRYLSLRHEFKAKVMAEINYLFELQERLKKSKEMWRLGEQEQPKNKPYKKPR